MLRKRHSIYSEDIKIDLTRINQINRTLSSLETRLVNLANRMEETTNNMIKVSEDAAKKLQDSEKENDNRRRGWFSW